MISANSFARLSLSLDLSLKAIGEREKENKKEGRHFLSVPVCGPVNLLCLEVVLKLLQLALRFRWKFV